MDQELIRRFGRDTSDEMNLRLDQRFGQHQHDDHERLEFLMEEQRSALDALEERVAETERLLGIEHHELPNVAYDGLASGDDAVVWDDFEFDQSVPPKIAKGMVDRGYGRR